MIGRLLDRIRQAGRSLPGRRQRIARARARLAAGIPPPTAAGPRQLLVDVSVIAARDAGTGIQRTVRAVTALLLANPPPGWVVRPVAATRQHRYRYTNWKGQALPAGGNTGIRVAPGDIFLGLDLAVHILPRHARQLAAWKRQGVALHFVVYDLLPLLNPAWFSDKLVGAFGRWVEAVTVLADSAICISPVTEADFRRWLQQQYSLAPGTLPTWTIPMGWDIAATQPSTGLPAAFDTLLPRIGECTSALVVGTLEPRKGHAQLLDAFEALWAAGKPCNLVIVGQPGWKTDALQQRLRQHPQRGRHLFWLADASDEALQALYQACDGAVVASLGEGYGLPLLEALGHGKPVLARDLPVFRQHGFRDVDYFSASDAAGLAPALDAWLMRIAGQARRPPQPLPTWQDTTNALVAGLCRHTPGTRPAPGTTATA